jgi:hypothetical protein
VGPCNAAFNRLKSGYLRAVFRHDPRPLPPKGVVTYQRPSAAVALLGQCDVSRETPRPLSLHCELATGEERETGPAEPRGKQPLILGN